MTTITIDRAVKALEALHEASLVWASPEVANAFSVLREALNAPQPEPVEDRRCKVKLGAEYGSDLDGNWFYLRPADVFAEAALFNHTGIGPQHLYSHTPQREWEPLSLDQISMAWDRAYRQPLSQAALNFARDIEQALKERNT